RSEWLNYDDRGLPVVRPHSLWERWFVSGENEGEAKIFQQFLDWRDEVRRVPVQVKPLADAAYEIRGSDFLRTPVNPSYALAFALTPTSQNQAPLLVQEGIMEVMLKQGTLSARVHHMEVRMEGLKAGQC